MRRAGYQSPRWEFLAVHPKGFAAAANLHGSVVTLPEQHVIEETRAGVVPLTLPAQILKALTPLSGVSIDALVTCPESPSFRENILITHRGLSGPAILQVSNYWRPGAFVSINLLPDEDVLEIISAARIIEAI